MSFHIRLFDAIAPVYGLFFTSQLKQYRKFLEVLEAHQQLKDIDSVMDFGFGTGALLKAFNERGFDTYGVDASRMMHRVAQRKLKSDNPKLYHANVLEGCVQCPDHAYDMTVSSFVIHGLKKEDRIKFYNEIKRITRKRIIFYEHSDTPSIAIRIAEFLEGGRYFSFIKTAESELRSNFDAVKIIYLNKKVTVYIAESIK